MSCGMFKNANESVFKSIYQREANNKRSAQKLNISAKDSIDYVQRLALSHRLAVHESNITSLCWNENGNYLLSAANDKCFSITNPHMQEVVLKYKSAHMGRISCARFMPRSNNHSIISCSDDGFIIHTDLLAPSRRCTTPLRNIERPNRIPLYKYAKNEIKLFMCHTADVTSLITLPDEPGTFLSGGGDSTVRLFDLRKTSSCHKFGCKENVIIHSPTAINVMAVAPVNSQYIAVGSSDTIVRIYDRRYLRTVDSETRPLKVYPGQYYDKSRITSIQFSKYETELLVNYSKEHLYLLDLRSEGAQSLSLSSCSTAESFQSQNKKDVPRKQRAPHPNQQGTSKSSSQSTNTNNIRMGYEGHYNISGSIREATFWGENYVMCGSDCRHIFVWNKNSGKLTMLLHNEKGEDAVNSLQPHPDLPILASSGNNTNIIVWAPLAAEADFNDVEGAMQIERNGEMIEQHNREKFLKTMITMSRNSRIGSGRISFGSMNW